MAPAKLESLKRSFPPFWINLDSISCNCLIRGDLKPVLYKKDALIFQNCDSFDSVYLVQSGSVSISITTEDGDKRTLYIAEHGCIFGELAAMIDSSYIYNAIAFENSYIYKIPMQTYKDEIDNNLIFNKYAMYILSLKTILITSQIKLLSFNDATFKVSYCLINMVIYYSIEVPEGYLLTKKFTHQNIADLTSLSRVSVSNIIKNLTTIGLLKRYKGNYLVKDIDQLIDYVI